MKLQNEVALVTGAAHGMGAVHADTLRAAGAKVVYADIDEDAGRLRAQAAGADGIFTPLDVTQEQSWAAAVASAESAFGPVTILVNNAGIAGMANVDDYALASWEKVIAVNQTGCFLGMRAVSPGMKRVRRGSIINVSSVLGMRGAAKSYGYVASKWAIRGMTRCAAIELAEYGIRANVILPGFIDTAMTDGDDPGDLEIPLRRAADPSEVSAAVVFLASSDSSFITGADLVIDGGQMTNISLYDRQHGVRLSKLDD